MKLVSPVAKFRAGGTDQQDGRSGRRDSFVAGIPDRANNA
jgi:hypothetical protein